MWAGVLSISLTPLYNGYGTSRIVVWFFREEGNICAAILPHVLLSNAALYRVIIAA